MFGLGATEIVVILIIALLVLGPKRLPEAARALGRGLGEFRRASQELRNALTEPLESPEPELRPRNALPVEASRPVPTGTQSLAAASAAEVVKTEPALEPAQEMQDPAKPALAAAADDHH